MRGRSAGCVREAVVHTALMTLAQPLDGQGYIRTKLRTGGAWWLLERGFIRVSQRRRSRWRLTRRGQNVARLARRLLEIETEIADRRKRQS